MNILWNDSFINNVAGRDSSNKNWHYVITLYNYLKSFNIFPSEFKDTNYQKKNRQREEAIIFNLLQVPYESIILKEACFINESGNYIP